MGQSNAAVEALSDMILSGRYRAGDRVPPEHELAEELGVSRNSLREAVNALSFAGVLSVRRGDGTYVTGLEPGEVLGTLTGFVGLAGPERALEIYGVRRILEPAATGRAVESITAVDIDRLRTLLTDMENADEPAAFVSADMAFHDTIVAATGNETLTALLAALRTTATAGLIGRARADHHAERSAIGDHERILAGIEAGDPAFALAAASAHLAEGEHWLRRAIEAMPLD